MNAEFTHIYKKKDGEHTFLLLHGTGGNEHDLIPLGETLDPEANLLSLRGQVNENGMLRFFARVKEGVLDLDDLARRSDDLAHFIEYSSRTYNFSTRALILVGFSNGANIGLHLLGKRPDLLRGALLLRPMDQAFPKTPANIQNTPVFIASGKTDPLVPEQDAHALSRRLTNAGTSVTFHLGNYGHAITDEDIQKAREWLQSLKDLS